MTSTTKDDVPLTHEELHAIPSNFLRLNPSVETFLRQLPRDVRRFVIRELSQIANRNSWENCEPMKGEKWERVSKQLGLSSCYRWKTMQHFRERGGIRAIFAVDTNENPAALVVENGEEPPFVYVIKMGFRDEVYK